MTLKIESFPIGSFACNCSLIYSTETNECIAIDPGNDEQAFLKQVNQRNLRLKYLLHTHAHFDHIGQSQEIKLKTKAKIGLHKDDLFLYQALEQQAVFFREPVGQVGEIDSYLEHEQTFDLDDNELKEVLKVIVTPGHTPGSCCFYSEKCDPPVLFSGDTLFRRSIGRTDLPGGNASQILTSIKKQLYCLADETVVITGHGPQTSIAAEKRQNPFVQS